MDALVALAEERPTPPRLATPAHSVRRLPINTWRSAATPRRPHRREQSAPMSLAFRVGHSPVSFLVTRKRQKPKLNSLIVCPSLARLPFCLTRSRAPAISRRARLLSSCAESSMAARVAGSAVGKLCTARITAERLQPVRNLSLGVPPRIVGVGQQFARGDHKAQMLAAAPERTVDGHQSAAEKLGESEVLRVVGLGPPIFLGTCTPSRSSRTSTTRLASTTSTLSARRARGARRRRHWASARRSMSHPSPWVARPCPARSHPRRFAPSGPAYREAHRALDAILHVSPYRDSSCSSCVTDRLPLRVPSRRGSEWRGMARSRPKRHGELSPRSAIVAQPEPSRN